MDDAAQGVASEVVPPEHDVAAQRPLERAGGSRKGHFAMPLERVQGSHAGARSAAPRHGHGHHR